MKKSSLFAMLGLTIVLFGTSCKKDDNTGSTGTGAQGTWSGTGQYGTSAGGPTYVLSLTFKANGTVDITGNNNTAIDNATGTWVMVQDSVRATYTYAAASATYTLSGKYSSTSNLMVGTIGLGTATTGVGLFSVTKQ
ncbi:MAG: hypothetical protein IPP96_11110 [Chitinophagaceae bacterium]|nr:hypothetical protein [Chitinophagaceae bacterium]